MNVKRTAVIVLGLLPFSILAQTNAPKAPLAPTSPLPGKPPMLLSSGPAQMPEKEKLSYAIGMIFGNNITNAIKRNEIPVDINIVLSAVNDVVSGKPTKYSEAEVGQVMNQLRGAMMAKRQADEQAAKAKGEEFLAKFEKEPGVVTLPEGVAYKVLQEGSGPTPKETDSVVMGYKGTLIDGTEFDHNDAFSTPVQGRTIRGWELVLPKMKTGAKWEVVIPSALAYGPRGHPPKIPANSTLVFEMELKSIVAAPAPPKPPTSGTPIPPNQLPTPPSPGTPVVSGEIIKVPSADELKHGAKIEVIKAGQTNAVESK